MVVHKSKAPIFDITKTMVYPKVLISGRTKTLLTRFVIDALICWQLCVEDFFYLVCRFTHTMIDTHILFLLQSFSYICKSPYSLHFYIGFLYIG